MVKKRRDAKIEYQKSVAVPRKRTRRTSPAEDDLLDTNLETLVNDSVQVDMSKGDADGTLNVALFADTSFFSVYLMQQG